MGNVKLLYMVFISLFFYMALPACEFYPDETANGFNGFVISTNDFILVSISCRTFPDENYYLLISNNNSTKVECFESHMFFVKYPCTTNDVISNGISLPYEIARCIFPYYYISEDCYGL
jgi:hypothetical protein